MMGVCPYSTNRLFHTGASGYEDVGFLSQCIADLNLVRKPDLCVVDSTEFIVTNGPAGPGEMKKPGKVVAGTDCVAVDALCAEIIGRNIDDIIMLHQAYEHKIGEINIDKLNIKEIEI